MIVAGRQKSIAFFIALGAGLICVIILLYVGWVLLNWRHGILLVLGALLMTAIISGVVLNTIFLVREIRRNAQHDAFINAVTHELKTPIASIRLYLETLQTRAVDDAKRLEFYRIMVDDSERLLGTIEQVLRTGRIGASSRRLNLSRIDLGGVVEQCVERVRTLHKVAPEGLEYRPGPPVTIVGDAEEVQAAVSNLIDNAVKYSGSDVQVTVETARVDGNYVALRVTDHGPGIEKTELKRIFKRFYRVPGALATRVKGTGLGLYIVRSVAKRHGGRAWAESEGPGHGATFVLQLADREMSRILVVEDEQHLAEGLRFNLEAEGYQVQVVDTGEAALDVLQPASPPFDVVILDVMLPGIDGFAVMSDMRQSGQFVPTLMLTARGHPDDVLRGFAAGADDYLTKPFELAILIARISGLLRRREWLRASMNHVTEPLAGAPAAPDDVFTFGDKSMYFDRLELHVRDQVFPLTLMEANVLRYLIRHEGKAVSRKAMLEEVWGLHEDTDTRAIDNFIVRLRRYIEDDPTQPRHLLTVRGVGYRFVASAHT